MKERRRRVETSTRSTRCLLAPGLAAKLNSLDVLRVLQSALSPDLIVDLHDGY